MPDTTTADTFRLLDRVRKLLAKAEDESCTPPEAQALTAKAAELMAKYGIDRALLADAKPETDRPGNRILDIDNPWARVKAHLLCGLGSALRCKAILISSQSGSKVHVFGFQSDLERLDVLYTSVLLQMWNGLRVAEVPAWSRSPRAYRRSWLLGFTTAVIDKVRAAEAAAVQTSKDQDDAASTSTGTALVLASREAVIGAAAQKAYPLTRTARVTYSGTGYGAGHAKGRQANIGGTSVGRGARAALR
jgi:Protein of unknown function (DUF2786)